MRKQREPKKKVATNKFLILFMVMGWALIELWKPWGEVIFWGITAVFCLRAAILFWQVGKMFFIAISFAIGVLESLIFLLWGRDEAVMESFWWIFILLFVILLFHRLEKKRNPEKMKKWELATKRTSLFENIGLQYMDIFKEEMGRDKICFYCKNSKIGMTRVCKLYNNIGHSMYNTCDSFEKLET